MQNELVHHFDRFEQLQDNLLHRLSTAPSINPHGIVFSGEIVIGTTIFVSCIPLFVEITVVLESANEGDIPIIATSTNNPAKIPNFCLHKKNMSCQ